MKLFEYADNVTLPNGKVLDQSEPKSYPFLYFDDKDFFIGDEGSTHMGSLENYFYEKENQEFLDIDPHDYDEKDTFLYTYLDAATYTGRVWLKHKIIAFWDLRIDAESRLRLKDIVKKLEGEFNIKIDTKEWWLEFSDTATGTPYFVILNDFIEDNNLKYGIMDTQNKVSSQVRKAWHLLNSAEKIKLKTQYGMDKYKSKHKPLPWKQALLKSEGKINENPDYIGKYNKSFYDEDSLAFGYYNGIMYVNPNLHGEHPDLKDKRLIRNDFTYPGRLWTDVKVISFWKYPEKEEFYKTILDIEENSDISFDDEWKVEVVHTDDMGYKYSDIVTFDEYIGSPDWTKTSFEQEHEISPLFKKNKKPPYIKRKTIEDRFEEYNESIRDKMTPKPTDDVINNLLKHEVEVDEYISEIKNSIIRYLKKNNINIDDVTLIDDLESIDFISIDLIKNKKDVIHYEDESDGMHFSYFNFYKDDIIIIGDDSGELNIAIVNINKLKDKLNSKNENNFVSLPIKSNNVDMKVNERVEAKMDLPQDIINFQKLFDEKGYKLYVVGGAVRDYLMGKKPHDFDMVTDTTPENVMKVLKDYRTDLQGVHFGVVRVFTNDEPEGYEIASYRKDISKGRDTKGTGKKVEIGDHITIKDDVKRRDLTMNALFYNIKTGEIVDVVGGMRDIKDKIVKAVGVPQKRFDEDRLRILRALRFAAVTDSKLDSRTEMAIRKDSRLFGISDVDDVSRERIFLEFKKVKDKARENNDPRIIKRFVDMLIDFDIMEQIFPVRVLEKSIRPTTYLTVAIAQVLRKNQVTPGFKQILIDSKIPTNFVEIISVLIRLYNNGVQPEDVYELYKEVRNKGVRRDILEEWINVMGIRDKSVIKFLDYAPTTTGKDVMDDGFKGAGIGNEIRKREAENFKKLLKESVIIKSFNRFKK